MVNKPHIRDVLADGNAPGIRTSFTEHPMAGLSVAMGFVPDDELGSTDIASWRTAEFPSTNAHVTALGMATFYNALAQGKLLSYEHMEICRISQGGFDTDLVLGPRVADHGWGLGYMLNQRGVTGPNTRTFGHGGSGGSLRLRRPRAPHRLRLRHEQLRRHQVQRRPAQRRALRRGLLRSGRNSRLITARIAVSCEYAGRMDGFLLVLIIRCCRRDRPGRLELVAQHPASRNAASLADAKADARRVIDRLGGQVINLTGTDDASKQALADASERFNAARRRSIRRPRPSRRCSPRKARWRGSTTCAPPALAMGMDPGPELESLTGQRSAGTVTEDRRVEFEGREIEASPDPSERTPNYYPGGRVAGRPVPAGWYSEPWWKPALVAGAWGVGSVFLFSALFSGMGGVGYDAQGFEKGYGDGYQDGLDAGQDGGCRRRRRGRWRRRARLRWLQRRRWRLGRRRLGRRRW